MVGSTELSSFTGAEIFHGPDLNWRYGTTLRDDDVFHVGDLKLTTLHTPGHTDESISYVSADLSSSEDPCMVFTCDALFVGDVGRTDLYGPEEAPRLAATLYDSIFGKILPFGDGVILCPAHGAGPVYGGNISERDESTLGLERVHNPVLQLTNRDEFIAYKVREHHKHPQYFRRMER